jgi:hypothetical protein
MNYRKRGRFITGIDTGSWITLRWVRGNRYYRVHLEQDLWRNWLLTKVNGRIGSRLGRARSLPAPSIEGGWCLSGQSGISPPQVYETGRLRQAAPVPLHFAV